MTLDVDSNGAFAFRKLADFGDGIAVRTPSSQLSGNAFATSAKSVARALEAAGVRPGDVCVVGLRTPLNTLQCLFGLWYLGATPLILDFRTPPQERAGLTQKAGAQWVVLDRQPKEDAAAKVIVFSDAWLDLPPLEDAPVAEGAALNAPAAILMSSGTTGLNKLFPATMERFTRFREKRYEVIPYPQGLALISLSLQFVASLSFCVGSLMRGQPVYLHPVLSSVEDLAKAVIENGITEAAFAPPTMRALIAHAGERDTPLFPDLRLLRVVGGPLAPEDKVLAYKRLSHHFSASFGSGMTGLVTVHYGQDVLDRPETAGRIVRDVRVVTVSEDGEELPVGTPGRMRVYSDTLTERALDLSHGNETVGKGWVMPGDYCVVDDDGFMTVLGRTTEMIVRGGVNISAAEVEAVLLQHPQVTEAAAVAIPDADYGFEVGVALVGESIDLGSVRAHCAARISPEKRPRKYAVVPSLPYNPSGKLLRRKVDLSIFDGG